jgi:FtsP/CotA-like multicopper oxidase with cupredoxin domain
MSTPIHVRDGDFLSVSVKNSLQATGLSIHWHGFEMTGHLELDGVVGITQCPISPGESFTYEWEVKETPGTYWYHTHSGELGIDAYNAIMGPLIVHPKLSTEGEDEEMASRDTADNDIPFLDPAIYANDPQAQQKLSMDELLFYGKERILFFQGGFLHSGAKEMLEKEGGLNPPISYNDDK